MTMPNNSYERFTMLHTIEFNTIDDVKIVTEQTIKINFKDCNIPIYLDGIKRKQFMNAWEQRITKTEITFLLNGCIVK